MTDPHIHEYVSIGGCGAAWECECGNAAVKRCVVLGCYVGQCALCAAWARADKLMDDNRRLREEMAALRAEVDALKAKWKGAA